MLKDFRLKIFRDFPESKKVSGFKPINEISDLVLEFTLFDRNGAISLFNPPTSEKACGQSSWIAIKWQTSVRLRIVETDNVVRSQKVEMDNFWHIDVSDQRKEPKIFFKGYFDDSASQFRIDVM